MTSSDVSRDATVGDLDLSEIRIEWPGYVELVFSLVIVWGFGDAVSTLFAAEMAGVHIEANPWIRLLLVHDPLLVIALKAAVVLYTGVVLLECRHFVERVPWWRAWLTGIVAVGTGIVMMNLYIGLVATSAMV
jgi:hypothetical protein